MGDIRNYLQEQNVVIADGVGFKMNQNYTFKAPSIAAGVLLGRATNGRMDWKTKDGRTLKEIQDGESGE